MIIRPNPEYIWLNKDVNKLPIDNLTNLQACIVATIIKNTSSKEQAAKSSGLENPASLISIIVAIANSEGKILAQIVSSTKDLNGKIESKKNYMAKQEARMKDVV